MLREDDYYKNHFVKLRFPWTLYHRPIVDRLERELARVSGGQVLNVGSGPFLELDHLVTSSCRFSVCDIDARAIEFARQHHQARLEQALVCEKDAPLPFPDHSFDLVVAMDVIEHLPEPSTWLAELGRVTRPSGRLYLTTPNYGSVSLRLIENTALELVARFHGFTRRGIHPTKMDRARLTGVFEAAGLGPPVIEELAFGWVLAATAAKSPATAEPGKSSTGGVSKEEPSHG